MNQFLQLGRGHRAEEEVSAAQLLLEWEENGRSEDSFRAAALRAYCRRKVQLIITQRRPREGPALEMPSGYLRGVIFYSDLGGA
jgi:hypothetical protein